MLGSLKPKTILKSKAFSIGFYDMEGGGHEGGHFCWALNLGLKTVAGCAKQANHGIVRHQGSKVWS